MTTLLPDPGGHAMGDRIRVARIATVCVCAMIVLGLQPANGAVLPFGLKIEKVLDNEVELGDLAVSPTGEFWLLERATGTVKVLVGGVEAASLTLPVRNTCDSGLLDVAFAPDYPRSGEALVSYLRKSRSQTTARQVFLSVRAPHGPLSPTAVGAIVCRALERTGLPGTNAHRLRHTAATQMLRAGASLDEIAQVLRHRSHDTTAIYAKVDRNALRTVIRPWPGGTS
jgi:hypothetical protein